MIGWLVDQLYLRPFKKVWRESTLFHSTCYQLVTKLLDELVKARIQDGVSQKLEVKSLI